ncbi:hypothetical protein J4462_01785 [Candidatus Pacearchaeota archaeon]|nr:hypothetical protein [Candidatus Pacearchaeota archaeon]
MTERKNRFVVLAHRNYPGKQDHLDILLEHFFLPDEENPLTKFEAKNESEVSTAEYKGNIRICYLCYEGPMSRNRGDVKRVDSGEWQINERGEIVFCGANIKGKYILTLRRIE